MRYLIPYILGCECIDRYDIWVHTHNCADIEFLKRLADKYPKINLVWQPDGIVGGNETINAFYRYCVEADMIYLKIDDDVIWMEDNALVKMLDYRIDHPDMFLVSPLIINNPLCTYLLQVSGKLPLRQYQLAMPLGPVLWRSGEFAYELHSWFLDKGFINNAEALHIGPKTIAVNRLSINAIMWFGEDMKKMDGIVPGDDEEFLSCTYPSRKGLANSVNGDCVMAHYAFFTQRQYLDASDLLDRYEHYFNEHPISFFNEITTVLNEVDSESDKLMSLPSPYRKPVLPKQKKTLKYYIWKCIPTWLWNKIRPEIYVPFIEK